MSSSWFQEFQNKRAAFATKNSSNPALDLRSVQTAQLAPDWNPRDFLADKGVNGVGEHLLDWGGRALDVISRPGYAVGGFLNNVLKAASGQDAENPWEAAGQGFIGKEKEFFSPWRTLDPAQEGDSAAENTARFITDFAASIAGDPLTYVPFANIGKVLSKAGDIAGITKAAEYLKPRNIPKFLEDLNPEAAPVGDSAMLPAAKTPAEISSTPQSFEQGAFWDTASEPSMPPRIGPEPNPNPEATASPISGDGAQGVMHFPEAFGNPGYIGPKPVDPEILDRASQFNGSFSRKGTTHDTQLAVLSIVRDAINKQLKDVRGKYNTSGLKDLYKIDQEAVDAALKDVPDFPAREFPEIPKPVAQDITREVEVPGIPAQQARRLSLIERDVRDDVVTVKSADDVEKALMENPGKDVYNLADKKYYDAETGSEYSPREWAQRAGFTTRKGFADYASNKVIRLFGPKDHPLAKDTGYFDMPLSEFEALFTPKNPAEAAQKAKLLEGLTLPSHSGKGQVPVNEYVASRIEKWAAGSQPSKKIETVPGKVTREEIAAYKEAVKNQAAERKAYEAARKAHEEKYHFGNMEAADKAGKKKIKPTRQELEKFLADNRIVLNTEEKRAFLRAANLGEKSFNTALSKMLERERKLNLTSLRELNEGVKSGRIDPAVQEEIWNRLGAKTLTQAENKLKQLDETITRMSAKTNAKPIPENETTFSPLGHDPELIGDIPKALEEPKLPVKEVVSNAKKNEVPSPTLAEAVVDDAVNAPTAAAMTRNDKVRLWYSIRSVIAKEWDRMQTSMPYRSPRGARKDQPTLFQGDAAWWSELNLHKQQNLYQSMINRVVQDAKKLGISTNKEGLQAYKYDKVMAMLKASDEIFRKYGLHPTTHAGGKGYPISLYDVLSSLPRAHVERHIFNTGRQILPTQYLELAHAAMDVRLDKGFTRVKNGVEEFTPDLTDWRDMVKGTLDDSLGENMVGKSASDYARTQAEKARQAELKKTSEAHGFDPANPPANYASDAMIRYQKIYDKVMGFDPKSKGSAHPLLQQDFVEKIQAKVKYNSDRAKIQYGQFVNNNAGKAVDSFLNDVTAAKTGDDVFKIIDEANGTVTKTIKEDATIIPPPGSVDAVKNIVEGTTGANMTTELATKQASAMERAKNANERIAVGADMHKAMGDYAEEVIRMSPTHDLTDKLEMTLWGKMVHAVAPHLAEGPLRNMLLSRDVMAGALTAQYSRNLGRIEQALSKPRVKQLFDDLQAGHAPSIEDAADYEEIRKAVARVFGEGRWGMKQNGIDPEHFNYNMSHFRIPNQFRFESKNPVEAAEEWRNWEIQDPFDFLSRMDAALQKTVAERSLGEGISKDFGKPTHQPGYVRVTASGGKSRIAHLIDQSLWYPQEVANMMRALDKTLVDMSKPGTHNRLLQIFDSATHAYKAGLTIYRPGHHMRNLYGDLWLGYMDGVSNPKYYTRAQRVMSTRKTHYKDFQFDDTVNLNTGEAALRFKQGGKDVTLSNDDVYRLAFKHGLLPDYGTIEDLGIGTRSAGDLNNPDIFKKLQNVKPAGGKVHRVASDVSEYRDHWVRIAHFLKVMEETKNLKAGNALEQIDRLAEQASHRVRKWHPNGSDLTGFEKNVARRTILFYSWIRKAIPLVIESAVMRPGRFLAYPKMMYTLAESQGIDLNGFTDPFPTDQLFPNWLGGTQGPTFGNAVNGYIGVRPGIPEMDILDQYFTSPGNAFQTIMGATNPVAKVPYELVTGSTTQGIPTSDVPKYLLGQVPFGNFVNTMVGKPIGGVSPSDEGYDPGGIRDPKALATLNLLTGLGVMDMSRPSYKKSAEFDVKYGRQGG